MPGTILFLTLLAFLAPTADVATPRCVGRDTVDRTVHLMGTLLRVRLTQVERACGLAAAEAAIAGIGRLEGVLSSWTAESELGRINSAPADAEIRVGAELDSLLLEAGRWVARTDGAFDPAVGALVDAWQLRGPGRVPTPGELAQARALSGWGHLSRTAAGTIRRGPAGWWLDSGAFGKGAGLRAAEAVLRESGVVEGVLDFGGQILTLGAAEIAVAHPVHRQEEFTRLRVSGGSMATTSTSERFVTVEGQRLGHVLDPRTGRPVPAWGSVSVWSRSPLVADVLSTALFVMGPEAAHTWASARDDVGVLVLIDDAGVVRVRANGVMEDFMNANAADGGGERGSTMDWRR